MGGGHVAVGGDTERWQRIGAASVRMAGWLKGLKSAYLPQAAGHEGSPPSRAESRIGGFKGGNGLEKLFGGLCRFAPRARCLAMQVCTLSLRRGHLLRA